MLKNNTLALALAALLVGGVATAVFMNNRDKSVAAQDVVPPASLATVRMVILPAAFAPSFKARVLPPCAFEFSVARIGLRRTTVYVNRYTREAGPPVARSLGETI